jgi:altronate dehydratase
VNAIARTGKPASGHHAPDEAAARQAGEELRDLVGWAAGLRRVEAPWLDLWIGTKCEQTDATAAATSCPTIGAAFDRLVPAGIHAVFGEAPELVGAADAVAARAASSDVARKWERVAETRQRELLAAIETGSGHPQPTPFNVAGGLASLGDKALSSLAKIGRTCRYEDVLGAAEVLPAKGGLYFMDTSSETEAIAQMSAGGCVLHLLATGGAVTIADPIAPVIQVNGNAATLRAAGGEIDLDVSTPGAAIDELGAALIALIHQVCAGALTASERHFRT